MMENTKVVNRITDSIRKEIQDGMLEAARMGVPWEVAFKGVKKFVYEKHNISEPISKVEEGKIGGSLNRWFKPEFNRLFNQFYVRAEYHGEKFCTKCGEKKSLSEFSNNRDSADGLQYWCKECYVKYNRDKKTGETELPTPLFKDVFEEVDSYTFTVSVNNMQVVYENGQMYYSRIDNVPLTERDIDDALRLRKRAQEKITNLTRGN